MRQVGRLIAIHGVRGVLKLLGAFALGALLYHTPARRRARFLQRRQDQAFDEKWGVDTCGKAVPKQSDVVGANWIHGSRYQGVQTDLLEGLISELKIDYDHYSFVDLGSGKGRAILTAQIFPFRRIIGVEYSKELADIAAANVAIMSKALDGPSRIELICGDAAEFAMPDGPLVLFLYNPFGKEVMSKVAKNVELSYATNPRRIIVLYYFAVCPEVWKDLPIMTEVRATKAISIYDTAPESACK